MFFGVHYQDQEGRARLGSIIGFSSVTDASQPPREVTKRWKKGRVWHQSMLGSRVEGLGIPRRICQAIFMSNSLPGGKDWCQILLPLGYILFDLRWYKLQSEGPWLYRSHSLYFPSSYVPHFVQRYSSQNQAPFKLIFNSKWVSNPYKELQVMFLGWQSETKFQALVRSCHTPLPLGSCVTSNLLLLPYPAD